MKRRSGRLNQLLAVITIVACLMGISATRSLMASDTTPLPTNTTDAAFVALMGE